MKKISDYYQFGEETAVFVVHTAFCRAAAAQCKELLFNKEEYECFIKGFNQQIPHDAHVSGPGKFIFWGIELVIEH